MGLGIIVGYLQDMIGNDSEGEAQFRSNLSKLNEVLVEKGIAPHVEPENLPQGVWSTGFSYGYIHLLRRAYVCVCQGIPLRQGDYTKSDDKLVEDETLLMSSHLLCHADGTGYYCPIDFDDPIFHDMVPGSMLGSSYHLRNELCEMAGALGIPKSPSLEELRDLHNKRSGSPFDAEIFAWAGLFEAATRSIEAGALIVFC